MNSAEARAAVAAAAQQLGLRGVIDVLVEHAHQGVEELTLATDRLAVYRIAADHRLLVQTSDKLFN